MACGGCNKNFNTKPPVNSLDKNRGQQGSVVNNLLDAVKTQPDKIKWFKDGISGLYKCLGGKHIYSDEDIKKNRDICRECEFSTKTNGKLTATSQCMGIEKDTGKQCGCFIMCKTSQGTCPLNKWVTLTIQEKQKNPEI